ncbi:MAG: UvrD-helicase domain-containing protein [Candidatus Micrarchaeota archaeon]|nr:UvrD-helicase domain-containing protein [Candidatus Micrarchaeota archaeon]
MEKMIRKILAQPFEIDENQKQAVLNNSKVMKLLACAGAGKTETLARKVCYLILVENLEPEEIVVFTFNVRAAKEIKRRIYDRMALYDLKKCRVG